MAVRIPKKLGHIWIGPKPPPVAWMQTWPEKHPKWDYTVYDNAFLRDYPFRNRRLINEYFWRGEYAGVQDLMRYEILYEFGGFMADADAVCLHAVDPLLTRKHAYTVYDRPGEEGRGVSPFLASAPGHPLLGAVIDRLAELEPWELRKPFHSTGNLFLMRMIREWGDDKLTIFPSHYFIPWHHTAPDQVYDGPDTVYAEQMWGTATWRYNRGEAEGSEAIDRTQLLARRNDLRRELTAVVQPDLDPDDLSGDARDPAVLRAGAHQMALSGALSDTDWARRLSGLNTALVAAFDGQDDTVRFNGSLFYPHNQDASLPEAPFVERMAEARALVASIMAGAERVMQIGVGTGHMLLLQKTLTPSARVVAVDACQAMFKGSARVDLYTPAAIDWFQSEFPDQIHFLTGRPAREIMKFRKGNRRWKFDLLHINGIDQNFLKSYGAAVGALTEDATILVHDMNPATLRDRITELQMLGEVGSPVLLKEYGPRREAVAILRRRAEAQSQ